MAQYLDSGSNTFQDIPKAPWYVLSNDPFFSDWGHSQGKTNTCVVACETWEEAKREIRAILRRRERRGYRVIQG